ncbi:unnamed protein product, partial [Brassica oleracea]
IPNAIVVDARSETHSTFFFLRLKKAALTWVSLSWNPSHPKP